MLGIPMQALPNSDDLDELGRVLAFDSRAGAWQPVTLDALTSSSGLHYSHWQPLPPPPAGRIEPSLAALEFQVEVCPPKTGVRLVSPVRVSHAPTGVSVTYGAARTEAINQERAQALLTSLLDGLTQHEAERELLEDSLSQALALVVLLAEAQDSPLSQLIDEDRRQQLEGVMADVAQSLPYFEMQGLWEGMAELLHQLVDIATADGGMPLRAVLLKRLPHTAQGTLVTAGDLSRSVIKSFMDGTLSSLFEEPSQAARSEGEEEGAHGGDDGVPGDFCMDDEEHESDEPLYAETDYPAYMADVELVAAEATNEDEDLPGFDEPHAIMARQGDDDDDGSSSDGCQEMTYAPDSDSTDFGFDR